MDGAEQGPIGSLTSITHQQQTKINMHDGIPATKRRGYHRRACAMRTPCVCLKQKIIMQNGLERLHNNTGESVSPSSGFYNSLGSAQKHKNKKRSTQHSLTSGQPARQSAQFLQHIKRCRQGTPGEVATTAGAERSYGVAQTAVPGGAAGRRCRARPGPLALTAARTAWKSSLAAPLNTTGTYLSLAMLAEPQRKMFSSKPCVAEAMMLRRLDFPPFSRRVPFQHWRKATAASYEVKFTNA